LRGRLRCVRCPRGERSPANFYFTTEIARGFFFKIKLAFVAKARSNLGRIVIGRQPAKKTFLFRDSNAVRSARSRNNGDTRKLSLLHPRRHVQPLNPGYRPFPRERRALLVGNENVPAAGGTQTLLPVSSRKAFCSFRGQRRRGMLTGGFAAKRRFPAGRKRPLE